MSVWLKEWEELDEIGQGGQGVVTKLKHKSTLNRFAVLKRIVPRWRDNHEAKQRLKQEIEALTTLGRLKVRVPAVYDSFIDHDNEEPFVIMEYINGIRFDEWLDEYTPTSVLDAAKITLLLADTIKTCHSIDIGHRDLKPANIILKNKDINKPYILDFGISFDSKQSYILTKRGEIFWNEFLTLPECQDQQGGHQDLRSDITALVGMFFSCLTGKPPIVLRDAQEIQPHRRRDCNLHNAVANASQRERIMWFFDKGFSYRIDDRYQSLKELEEELLRIMNPNDDRKLDLIEQIDKLEKTARSRRRPIQIELLRDKLAPIEQHLYASIKKSLDSLNNEKIIVQAKGFPISNFNEENRLPSEKYELINDHVISYTLSREHISQSAVLVIAFFAIGMQIHMYITTYISGGLIKTMNNLNIKWHKISVIDEASDTLSNDQELMIVDEVKNILAREISNITDLELQG